VSNETVRLWALEVEHWDCENLSAEHGALKC